MTEFGQRLFVGACMLMVFPAVAADSQVWQWTDNAGVRHFSDQPPAVNRASVLALPNHAVDVDVSSQQRLQRQQEWLQERKNWRHQQQQERAANEQSENARRNECRIMLGRLKDYERSGRLYSYDSDSERQFLSDQEVDAFRQRYAREYQARCD